MHCMPIWITDFVKCPLLQLIKVSKDPGPKGPRGFNGTNGLHGRPGFSNWTLCSYKQISSRGGIASSVADEAVQIIEPKVSHTMSVTNHPGSLKCTLCRVVKSEKVDSSCRI